MSDGNVWSLVTTFFGIVASGLLSWWIAHWQTERGKAREAFFLWDQKRLKFQAVHESLHQLFPVDVLHRTPSGEMLVSKDLGAGERLIRLLEEAAEELRNAPYFLEAIEPKTADYARRLHDEYAAMGRAVKIVEHEMAPGFHLVSWQESYLSPLNRIGRAERAMGFVLLRLRHKSGYKSRTKLLRSLALDARHRLQ